MYEQVHTAIIYGKNKSFQLQVSIDALKDEMEIFSVKMIYKNRKREILKIINDEQMDSISNQVLEQMEKRLQDFLAEDGYEAALEKDAAYENAYNNWHDSIINKWRK